MDFRSALTTIYLSNPCQALPNALWKTLSLIDVVNTSLVLDGGTISQLKAWDDERILVAWDHDRSGNSLFPHPMSGYTLALIHTDYLQGLPAGTFSDRNAYFRLVHRSGDGQAPRVTHPGISFVPVEIVSEKQQVADLISQCYPNIHPTVDDVKQWLERPVFKPDLWLWAVDDSLNMPVGLGIAEEDQEIREGSLEWIQVLPAYQGRGIGKCLVLEMLSRLTKRVDYTTVSGEVDNTTHPEALYRSCGFTGSDIWWVLHSRSIL